MDYVMAAMKKFQLSVQQDHAKAEEPVRYANSNTLQVYTYLCLKANPITMVLMLMILLLKVILQVLVVH